MNPLIKDSSPFLGTGENNEEGKSLDQFLEEYTPGDYDNPAVTTDVLVFTYPGELVQVEEGLSLLMIRRRNHPSIGQWALPGGFAEIYEDLEAGAKRELLEETNLSNVPMELVSVYGEANRDPRYRIITASYVALVEENTLSVKAGDDAADACFFQVTMKKLGKEEREIEGVAKICTQYQVFLENQERQVQLETKVEEIVNQTGFLKEKRFEIIENQGIAFDHPRFILEALLYIQKLL